MPEKTSPEDPQYSLRKDTVLLVFCVALVTALAIKLDAMAWIIEWSREHDSVDLVEIVTILMVSGVALLIFSLRRVAELKHEMKRRNHAESSIHHIAMHDPLTNLPNRVMGKQRLDKELSRGRRDGTETAVLAMDLDRFKRINEIYGQDVGDKLLGAFVERVQDTIRDMDTLVRIGADEFVVLQPGVVDHAHAKALADRLLDAFTLPLVIQDQAIATSISIGITVSSSSVRDAKELLRRADIARVKAKALGGSSYRFFEVDMHKLLKEKEALEREFRVAMEGDIGSSLSLHYQPLFNVHSKGLLGFEALLRWQHPERGFISPADFIPLAEETGLIIPLGEWVLKNACADCLKWAGECKVAVNLSPIQFRDRDMPEKVAAIISATGLPPERLELEITEGVLIEDVDTALSMLLELKALGVRISMDDFGTGYSSLSYLKRFPFDKIKIDRSFVSQLELGSEDAAIVKAILAMGHSLGMVATAEGVESSEQLDYLTDEGCDEAQGFLLGRPMPFENALALSRESAAALSAIALLDPATPAANDGLHKGHAAQS